MCDAAHPQVYRAPLSSLRLFGGLCLPSSPPPHSLFTRTPPSNPPPAQLDDYHDCVGVLGRLEMTHYTLAEKAKLVRRTQVEQRRAGVYGGGQSPSGVRGLVNVVGGWPSPPSPHAASASSPDAARSPVAAAVV